MNVKQLLDKAMADIKIYLAEPNNVRRGLAHGVTGNTGLMSSGDSLISWGEGSFLAFVGNPSRDGV